MGSSETAHGGRRRDELEVEVWKIWDLEALEPFIHQASRPIIAPSGPLLVTRQ